MGCFQLDKGKKGLGRGGRRQWCIGMVGGGGKVVVVSIGEREEGKKGKKVMMWH